VKAVLPRRIWGPSWPRLLVGDAIVLALLVAGIVAVSLPRPASGSRPRAEVLVGGERVATLDLSRDGVHELLGPQGVTRIEVRGGRVRVESSPCPRQICRHGGWIGKPGELLVCLPNEVIVRVQGEGPEDPAAISR
jgi:hypothetical protein